MEELKFRLRDGEFKILKKAKGKRTWRELMFEGVEALTKEKTK